MPALDNPRWELFAQKIVEGLVNGDRKAYSQGRAYSGDAPDFVEVGEAGVAVRDAMRHQRCVQLVG